MAIVASVIVSVGVQRDGRRWVLERHTDQTGAVYDRNWLAGAADDLNAALAAYATQLGTDLANAEIGRNVAQVTASGSLAVVSTIYSTNTDNLAALRAAYQSATQTQAIMIGDFLSSLTDAQLRSIFSMTQAQVNSLRTNKLTPATSAATTIRNSTGA